MSATGAVTFVLRDQIPLAQLSGYRTCRAVSVATEMDRPSMGIYDLRDEALDCMIPFNLTQNRTRILTTGLIAPAWTIERPGDRPRASIDDDDFGEDEFDDDFDDEDLDDDLDDEDFDEEDEDYYDDDPDEGDDFDD